MISSWKKIGYLCIVQCKSIGLISNKWLQFEHSGKSILLQGIKSKVTWGPPISAAQLQTMQKRDSILYMVQINSVEDKPPSVEPIPPDIQAIIAKFQSIFQPLPGIPPKRAGDHTIPLIQGAQPFRLRPYRYNRFQKDEIEMQIKELLQKGLIQSSSSPFASPSLLVCKKTGD